MVRCIQHIAWNDSSDWTFISQTISGHMWTIWSFLKNYSPWTERLLTIGLTLYCLSESFFRRWYIIYKEYSKLTAFYIYHQVLSGPYCVFNSVFLHWPHNIWLILYEAYTNIPEITCHIQYQYQVLAGTGI